MQAIVDPLADAGGDDSARAVKQAHEVLAAHDGLAGRGEHLPDGRGNRSGQDGCRPLAKPLLFLCELLAQRDKARVAIAALSSLRR